MANPEVVHAPPPQMINNMPVVDGLQPGFVSGSERVEFPYKHSQAQLGWYMCYKPFEQPWRMIKYIHPLQSMARPWCGSAQQMASSVIWTRSWGGGNWP